MVIRFSCTISYILCSIPVRVTHENYYVHDGTGLDIFLICIYNLHLSRDLETFIITSRTAVYGFFIVRLLLRMSTVTTIVVDRSR